MCQTLVFGYHCHSSKQPWRWILSALLTEVLEDYEAFKKQLSKPGPRLWPPQAARPRSVRTPPSLCLPSPHHGLSRGPRRPATVAPTPQITGREKKTGARLPRPDGRSSVMEPCPPGHPPPSSGQHCHSGAVPPAPRTQTPHPRLVLGPRLQHPSLHLGPRGAVGSTADKGRGDPHRPQPVSDLTMPSCKGKARVSGWGLR